MASWGDIAVGQMRHSSNYPSKSAIVGLLGAALGVQREDDQAHLNLTDGYQQAVKVLSIGRLLKDYHTSQAPDSAGKFNYRTRRDEIVAGRDRLGTVLSTREYFTDAQALVALQAKDIANWTLDELQQALHKPKFHLYLGRKACPLAAPLAPQVITAEGFRDALDNYQLKPLLSSHTDSPLPEWQTDKRWLPQDELARYYWEGTINDFANENRGFSTQQVQQLTRHDKPLSRQRWQFQQRKEYCWINNPDMVKEA
jgi:CRISPR system Cascade subunit CasD